MGRIPGRMALSFGGEINNSINKIELEKTLNLRPILYRDIKCEYCGRIKDKNDKYKQCQGCGAEL